MFDLDRFIADCRAALQESSPQSAVKELVVDQNGRSSSVARGRFRSSCQAA
jgi:hypothetical protein